MKYRNEEDKCYGITGMAIGITIWNGEDMLYKLDLDNEASQYVQFTSDYYFSGNPGIPAKESWHYTLKHYQMTVGMLIGNMMCRSLKKNDINYSKVKKALYKSIAEEGKRTCQLEEDEIKTMFDDTYRYLEQVFSNRSVRDIANDFLLQLYGKNDEVETPMEDRELADAISQTFRSMVVSIDSSGVQWLITCLDKISNFVNNGYRREACEMLAEFIEKTPADFDMQIQMILRMILKRASDRSDDVLAAAWKALNALFTRFSPTAMVPHIAFISSMIATVISTERYKCA